MKFTMNDLPKLVEAIGSSSKNNDKLPAFMERYDFIDQYTTADDSIVFQTGNEKGLELEFFDMEDVYKRSLSVIYWEVPYKPMTVLEWEDLQKLY